MDRIYSNSCEEQLQAQGPRQFSSLIGAGEPWLKGALAESLGLG